MTAASIKLTLRKSGANRTKAAISKMAGTNDIRTAGRPTFFKSDTFNDNPALIRMIISAICLRSDEMLSMDGSRRFKRYGPSTMPVTNMPMILGNLMF